jgi:hypothetical protein
VSGEISIVGILMELEPAMSVKDATSEGKLEIEESASKR